VQKSLKTTALDVIFTLVYDFYACAYFFTTFCISLFLTIWVILCKFQEASESAHLSCT